MKIRILCVGRIKEAWMRDGIAEYSKRIGRYAEAEICECADEPTPDAPSAAQKKAILEKEGARLLAKHKKDALLVALAIDGKDLSSEAFSSALDKWMTEGHSTVEFVIGGSLGLSDAVLSEADVKLSFSRFTFPHQLMRLILLEQVYRAFKILLGEPYHK